MGVCNKIMHLHDSKNTLIQGTVGTYLNEFPPMNWRCNGWRHAWTRRSEDHELSRRSGQRLEESLQPSRHVTLDRIKRQHKMMWYLFASSKVKVHYIYTVACFSEYRESLGRSDQGLEKSLHPSRYFTLETIKREHGVIACYCKVKG